MKTWLNVVCVIVCLFLASRDAVAEDAIKASRFLQ
jgi:hypothetical protein